MSVKRTVDVSWTLCRQSAFGFLATLRATIFTAFLAGIFFADVFLDRLF